MTMAPVPAYECLRADSEDSGLGPSPAKSLTSPTSPEGSVSPIRLYDDRCSDSLLDLSPRTDNSSGDDLLSEDNHNGCCDTCDKQQTTTDAIIPSQLSGHPVVQGGSFHQFLLSASKNCVVNNSVVRDTSIVKESSDATTTEEDYRIRFSTDEFEGSSDSPASVQPSPSQEDEEEETFDCTSSSSAVVESIPPTDYVRQNNSSLLNPKVVLIRSDFGGQYAEESCSQQSSSVGTAASSVEDAAADCCPSTCEDGACKWLNCERSADANTTATDLIDHIRQCHVQNQPEDAESFVCLWVGCKVYAKPSCSRSWLERHVLLHGGSKPFRCIVAGCRQRFGSEAALQRHVNSHFPQAGKHHHPNHQHRLSRNRRRNFKLRRRPQSHKSKDFFDDATMEHVRHHLLQLSSIESVVTSGPPSAITFHSTITGKRINEAGKVNFLLRWSPENMVPDSWVSEEDLCRNAEKTIPISQLPPEALQPPVMDALGLSGAFSRPGKRKRK